MAYTIFVLLALLSFVVLVRPDIKIWFFQMLLKPLGLTILTQQIAKQIRHGDYIPKGGLIPEKTLRFELIPPTHVYRCCQQTGNDMQSGPYYCGEIATYAAAVPGGHVALCDVHMQKRSETIRSALIEQDN